MTSGNNKREGMERPRVLVIDNSVDFTGGLNSALRGCELLKGYFDFSFLVPSGSLAGTYIKEHGFALFELPMKEIRKNIFSLLVYFPFLLLNSFRLARLARRNKFELMVSNDFYNLILPVYKSMGGTVPYICYVRFLPSKFPKLLVRMWCYWHERWAVTMISVSEIVKRELNLVKEVIVISNEFPRKKIDYTVPEPGIILYPANYIYGKGHLHALQCFARLQPTVGRWRLKFIGGDMGLSKNKLYKKRLMEKGHQLGIDRQVEWGEFSRDIERDYLDAAVVLNFSESESFSLTCLEAMFYGRPVLATRSGGPQEIIENRRTGVLVDVGDVDAMTEELRVLIANPALRNELARSAYDHVRDRFDLTKIQNQLCEVYSQAIAKAG